MLAFLQANWSLLLAGFLALDRVIMKLPGMQSNGLVQAIGALIEGLGKALGPGQPPAAP